MFPEACDILCPLGDLSHGLRSPDAIRVPTQTKRLITYSKRYRRRATSKDPPDAIRALVRATTSFNKRESTLTWRDPVSTVRVVLILRRHRAFLLLFLYVCIWSAMDWGIVQTTPARILGRYTNVSGSPQTALIGAIKAVPLAQETISLIMLIIFRNSSYIESWHAISEILLEALDGYYGPFSERLMLGLERSIIGSAVGHIADIIFDVMVLVEIANRRSTPHPDRKDQTKCLKQLLKRIIFSVDKTTPPGLVLSHICVPGDESRDELDLFQYSIG
ncbi:hypothetical protein B0H13DRAFT_1899546 [Mycena leptocephala]|nr:hypothetical protein B0H13DRAFT_1899546 [Mycena leptocephala]